MVKIIHKYYLMFPPISRKVIDFSILAFMNGLMVEYYHSDVENVLMDCDELIKINKQ